MVMLRSRLLLAIMLTLSTLAVGQSKQVLTDTIATYFQELRAATKAHEQLWDMDLFDAILLVDPQTRQLYATHPDTLGVLSPCGSIFCGVYPAELNIANTAINWGGRRWAMIMLPLSPNRDERINLMAHELFHSAQPALKFTLGNPTCNHLDEREGRIYARLELEALKQAVRTEGEERSRHIADALTFRLYRQSLYKGATEAEDLLELNEGVAEYTGQVVADIANAEYFDRKIAHFYKNPSFVRSFAYETIPMYGYLLRQSKPYWNKELLASDPKLTAYFTSAFNVVVPSDLTRAVAQASTRYATDAIVGEEKEREEKIRQQQAEYTRRFVDEPHLTIRLEKMNISFDPRRMFSLGDRGTVYPSLRLVDSWGILEASNGALMSADWRTITLSKPLTITPDKLSGDGWSIALNEAYRLHQDEQGGYTLVKK